jgi:hypothetical protein
MSDTKLIIRSFGESSTKLAKRLKEEANRQIEDQIAIENHILIVQLAMTLAKYSPKRPTPLER